MLHSKLQLIQYVQPPLHYRCASEKGKSTGVPHSNYWQGSQVTFPVDKGLILMA